MKDDLLKYRRGRLEYINNGLLVLITFAIIALITIFSPNQVMAKGAFFYLSPSSNTYNVGTIFSVKVEINSGDQSINAAEGKIVFNPNELQVINLSKLGSIFPFWTTEPAFSNSTGNIIFGGGCPSPFLGSRGTVITINFRAKNPASARVNFLSGSILASDGKGTNVLSTMKGGLYNLESRVSEESTFSNQYLLPGESVESPSAPLVSSPTHPDQDKWYSNSSPKLQWKLPDDVTSCRLLLNKKSQSVPTVVYTPPIDHKDINYLPDGIWYFHIQFRNKSGWGKITHRKILIDTEPPSPFKVNIDDGGDPTNPTPDIYFNATDSLSGLQYYTIKIDDKDYPPVVLGKCSSRGSLLYYTPPPQKAGKHSVLVKVVDAAGNSTVGTTDFTIKPLKAPIITDIPEKLVVGGALVMKGTSDYPGATVRVFVAKNGELAAAPIPYTTKVDQNGNWTYIHPYNLEQGEYKIWADVVDLRGAESMITPTVTTIVTLPTFLRVGKIAINYLTVAITLIVLIIGIIFLIFYVWYKIALWRKRLREETAEANKDIARILKHLRGEIEERIEYLDGKPGLTSEEKQVKKDLEKALAISKKSISKKVRNINNIEK